MLAPEIMNYAATYVPPRQVSFGSVVLGNLLALALGPLGLVLGVVGLFCCLLGFFADGRGDHASAERWQRSASATARLGTWGSLVLYAVGAIGIVVFMAASR